MEQSVLDKISPIGHFNYHYDGWRNGKIGSISNVNGDCIYRFIEADRDDNGYLYDIHKDIEDNPIVITGIVGWWLLYRKNPTNRIVSDFKDAKIESLSIREQYDKYTELRFKQYKDAHKDDPRMWDWEDKDWKRAFYCEHIIPHEKELNARSEPLFDFISESDAEQVRLVMENYINYLKKYKDEITLKQEDEIVKQLLPYFSSEQNAKKYVKQIKGLKDTDIVIITNKYWDASFISEEATPTAIWRVLHDNGIYTSGDRNWRSQVKFNLIKK